MNAESQELINQGRSSLKLVSYPSDDCFVADPMFPETAVGIAEPAFLQWCGEIGLEVKPPIHYGSWCGREKFMSYQDIVLLSPIA